MWVLGSPWSVYTYGYIMARVHVPELTTSPDSLSVFQAGALVAGLRALIETDMFVLGAVSSNICFTPIMEL